MSVPVFLYEAGQERIVFLHRVLAGQGSGIPATAQCLDQADGIHHAALLYLERCLGVGQGGDFRRDDGRIDLGARQILIEGNTGGLVCCTQGDVLLGG